MPRPRKHEKAPAGQTMNVDPVMSYMGGGVRMLHSAMEGMNHKMPISNIINTTTEGSEIRTAMKGIIETSVPPHKQSGLHKAKPTATPHTLGMRHISGTTY